MLVKEKIGNINFFALNNRKIDYLLLEWYESNKRILHKKTQAGIDIAMKFLSNNQQLSQGDIVYEDDFSIVVIDIKECDVLSIRPRTILETANICYEIGNKHLPLFYQDGELLVAYDASLLRLLNTAGYDVKEDKRKLLNPLKTSVSPHGHEDNSLFSKIMKRTSQSS